MSANGRVKSVSDEAIVAALAGGATYANAATAAGVSSRTVRRRMEDPDFRGEVAAARRQAVEQIRARLTANAPNRRHGPRPDLLRDRVWGEAGQSRGVRLSEDHRTEPGRDTRLERHASGRSATAAAQASARPVARWCSGRSLAHWVAPDSDSERAVTPAGFLPSALPRPRCIASASATATVGTIGSPHDRRPRRAELPCRLRPVNRYRVH